MNRGWTRRDLLGSLLVLPAGIRAVQQELDELSAVIDPAVSYAARYERDLGNLIASEDYVQNATLFGPGRVVRSRLQRRIQSDFLIVQLGGDRVGVRRVNKVDGKPVKSKEVPFEEMSGDSPSAIRKQLASLREESTRYDIGDIQRDNNVPTYALKVLRRLEVLRFMFARDGTEKIQGIPVWKVKFREVRPPTFLKGANDEPLFSSGTLWVEPSTGLTLRTEFVIENPASNLKEKGRTVVHYEENQKLGFYVPREMVERYETTRSSVDCRASYSDFRLFQVDVTSDIKAPASLGEPEPH